MDTDQQVRLDFLSEAEEYFDNLESILMSLDSQGAEPSLLDTAMRAAHSLKGGAAMMHFVPLSNIAHRLEDFLKILRVRKDDSLVDREVTTLLLRSVDCLREVRNLHQQQDSIEDDWLDANSAPIFQRLRQKLGDLQEADEDLLLAEEEQVDVSTLIFNSGVEDCLESFEVQIDVLEPAQLKEELKIQAEQLAEFGQMSNIEPFVSLCHSVLQQLAVVSLEGIKDLARQAFKQWERSHALVLVGRLDKLPSQLGMVSEPSLLTENHDAFSVEVTDVIDSEELAAIQNFAAQQLASEILYFSEPEFDFDELAPDTGELLELDDAFAEMDAASSPTDIQESTDAFNLDLDELVPDTRELSDLDAAFPAVDVFTSESQASTSETLEVDLDELIPDAAELSDLDAAFSAMTAPPEEPQSIVDRSTQETPLPDPIPLQQPKLDKGRMVRVPRRATPTPQ